MPENPSLNKRTIILAGAVCLVLGFLAGFFLANGINRQEQDKLRAEVASLRADGGAKDSQKGGGQGGARAANAGNDDGFPTLTDEQLAGAVAKADQSPQDLAIQRQVGQALYVYAWQRENATILPDVARILKRAHDLDPKDYKTTVMAGDAQFLIARSKGDTRPLAEARKLYETALSAKPEDAVVRTSYGLTYYYDSPPDARRAIREYRLALKSDPRQELPLQSLAAALIETGEFEEAASRVEELEKLNPSNRELADLRTQLEQKRNAAKEKQ
jgi:tetratricopeptide (TPR) repeat protein